MVTPAAARRLAGWAQAGATRSRRSTASTPNTRRARSVVSGVGFKLIIGSPRDVDQRLLLPVAIFGLAVIGSRVHLAAAMVDRDEQP